MAYSKKIRRLILPAAIIVLASLIFANRILRRQSFPAKPAVTEVRIGEALIRAETVSRPEEQYRGLSDRPSLCADCGLLFLFGDEAIREFVMRRMEFPLDIIFIDRHRVINIAHDLPPEGEVPKIIYKSEASADAVLEVNGGYAARKGIKAGDYVEY